MNRVWKARASLDARRGSASQETVPRRVNAARTTRDKLNCTSGSGFTTSAVSQADLNIATRTQLGDKRQALKEALSLSAMMSAKNRYAEAEEFLRGKIPEARALLGPRDKLTLHFREMRCMNIVWDPEANAAAVRGILPELEDLCRVTRQVYGATHPGFLMCQNYLKCARGRLAGQPCMTKRGGTYTLIPAVRE